VFDLPVPVLQNLGETKLKVITRMIDNAVNAPLTSSLGRLFDAVAAIIGLRSQVVFEGQAAMELEMIAHDSESGHYDFAWNGDTVLQIATGPIIQGVIEDVTRNISPAVISARFHNTLVTLFDALCRQLRDDTGIDRVALSGGVFQNSRLFTGLSTLLEKSGFSLLTHRLVPTNDGGISLGQAVVAAASINQSKRE
jgi:hydrogenase maturation protein HypF